MSANVTIRPARRSDLQAIVALFHDDELHAPPEPRGAEVAPSHIAAFDAMQANPDNVVYVAELGGDVVGTFQLTFVRQLSYGGCCVAQVESVHVSSRVRSRGIGRAMLEWAVAEARRRGALRIQLTSRAERARARRFYEQLGFRATHVGLKLYLA